MMHSPFARGPPSSASDHQGDGGIGMLLSENEVDGEGNPIQKYNASRFAYDFLYLNLVTIIMVSVVAGLIIDTFGSLREQENERVADMENKCFICGIQKYHLSDSPHRFTLLAPHSRLL